ncbi:MAG: rRNA maturation RNase YbeY [Anaerolineales bacterium]|nr:rRNA maturation RNase YbeY [Anaerolineales bacterium]
MILITVQEPYRDLITDQILFSAAELSLQQSQVEDSPSLSVRITDNQEIKNLNQQFRGINRVTDVLSFPTDFTDPDLDSRYVGDVVISYPQAEKQAQNSGHPVGAELQLLVVHGVLHLLGYDHGDENEKEKMWSLQAKILEKLGLNIQVEEK